MPRALSLLLAALLRTAPLVAQAAAAPAQAAPVQPVQAASSTKAPAAADLRDLPLVEVAPAPATQAPGASGRSAARALPGRSLAILITGDGNWAAIDQGIAGAVAAGGVPVVGLKARVYLEHGTRTPDGLTRDVERVARAYLPRWGRDRLVLLGFSRGADFLPFVVNRLAPDLRDRLALVGMYGAEQGASFQFHLLDLFSDTHRATDLPVAPELARMIARPGVRAFCVYGADEKDSVCKTAPDAPTLRRVERGGAHHFDKDYPGLGRLALEELGR